MTKICTFITRGKKIESLHHAKCLVVGNNKEILLSTNNDNDIIFPRSAIKLFQAIPFVASGAATIYNLNSKQIALSCSSHSAEPSHVNQLSKWLKKLKLKNNSLQCGIHNPLNSNSSNILLLSGKKPNQLHNNCSGKHLGMISGSLANKYEIKNYLEFDHPYQQIIRKTLEQFTESQIVKKNYGIDGCSAPQYAFKINNLSTALLNLVKSYDKQFIYNQEINTLLNSILKNPFMIAGKNRFDTDLIKISNSKIFCKGGAEGVFLFAHLRKKIVGVIKISDGNERAIPSIVCLLLDKLKITSPSENLQLENWKNIKIRNHAKNITGEIYSIIK